MINQSNGRKNPLHKYLSTSYASKPRGDIFFAWSLFKPNLIGMSDISIPCGAVCPLQAIHGDESKWHYATLMCQSKRANIIYMQIPETAKILYCCNALTSFRQYSSIFFGCENIFLLLDLSDTKRVRIYSFCNNPWFCNILSNTCNALLSKKRICNILK